MKNIRTWTWELLQNLVALIVSVIFHTKIVTQYKGVKLHHWNLLGGMSLGNHIFLPAKYFADFSLDQWDESTWHREYILHEYGHCIQSAYLGPLYLFVIGLPSLIWASCFTQWREKHNKTYYWFYTEKWADKLGGIIRETKEG